MSTDLSNRPHTISENGSRVWLYPQEVYGKYFRIRLGLSIFLISLFYALPWISLNGNPFIRLSLSSQSFYFLGKPILSYEFYHFVFLFVLAFLFLFLLSAVRGRVWCGYGCPQTIFIDIVFRSIERLIEGPASHRKIVDSKKKTMATFSKKIFKQALFFLVSLSFGLTLVSYFTNPREVFLFSSNSEVIATILLTSLAWFDGAYWREQFCHMVCPYARLQSVMTSKASVTVGYDKFRGEPRKRGRNREGAGDCIDCGYCVRVCPSGIDIRQAVNQLECIGCAKCIDACDSIMTSLQKSSGLIRYDSEYRFLTGSKSVKSVFKQPRTIILIVLCLSIFIGGFLSFLFRSHYHIQILTVPGTPFVLDGKRIKNIYTIKIGNQSDKEASFSVRVSGVVGAKIESPSSLDVIIPGEEKIFPLLISFDSGAREEFINIEIKSNEGFEQSIQRLLLKPSGVNK